MYWCAVMCCVLWSASVSPGLQCTSPDFTHVKLSIASRRNETGHWIAQVSLDHEGRDKKAAWEVDVNHTTAKCENSESVHLVATITAPPPRPGPNYEGLPGVGGYYKFHASMVTWPVAREVCAKEGAHLLILNSNKEFEAVKKVWDQQPKLSDDWRNDFVHIGMTDYVTEGQFITLFGEHVNSTGYTRWADNEPNSGTGANCAGVTRTGLLMDSSCHNLLAFFCEEGI